jgi:hypothetical protein
LSRSKIHIKQHFFKVSILHFENLLGSKRLYLTRPFESCDTMGEPIQCM